MRVPGQMAKARARDISLTDQSKAALRHQDRLGIAELLGMNLTHCTSFAILIRLTHPLWPHPPESRTGPGGK